MHRARLLIGLSVLLGMVGFAAGPSSAGIGARTTVVVLQEGGPGQWRIEKVIPGEHSQCFDGYACLYEHWHFNHDNPSGVLYRFQCAYSICGWQSLSTCCSFNDKMSSWINHRDKKTILSENGPGQPNFPGDCLTLAANSQDDWVGDTWNDRASGIAVDHSTCP